LKDYKKTVQLICIYTTINFTRLSVTMEVGALYGRLIYGWLGVVWAWLLHGKQT